MEKLNLWQRLANVQKELKAPKGQFNSFGKYKYRSAEDILEVAKPLCVDFGLLLTVSDELVLIGERYYIKATAKVINIDTGENYSVDSFAREEESKKGMDGSQVTGASSSYARKYALNGLFALDDTKDSDATNKHGKDEESYPSASSGEPKVVGESDIINDKQSKLLFAKSKGYEAQAKEILAKHGFTSSKQITKDKFNDILADLQKVINDGI
jgi:hypothetical protein